MTEDATDIRHDAEHYTRHLTAFYIGLTPTCIALLYVSFFVQSFIWFLVVVIAGCLATFAITMCILPYPICATCGRTVRQRPRPTYYCSACNIQWIVEELHKPCCGTGATCESTGTRSTQAGG
jgi:sorbitol-specific phosphotransferase system component IIC